MSVKTADADLRVVRLLLEQDWATIRGYGDAVRDLPRLLVPGLVVFVPLAVAATVVLWPLGAGSFAIVDGDVALIGDVTTPLLVAAVTAVVASAAGYAIALSATVLLVAGRLFGRPVSWRAALRAAARRWGALLVLGVVAVVAMAAVLAAGIGTLLVGGETVHLVVVTVVTALIFVPCLLAVPAVMLEGWSGPYAIVRAYRLSIRRFWGVSVTLGIGAVAVPVAARRALDAWVLPAVPDAFTALASGTAATVLGMITLCVEAAVITRVFLYKVAERPGDEPLDDLRRIRDDLPGDAPRPVRAAPVAAALLLPGLLYALGVAVNPAGWTELAETVVTADWRRGTPLTETDRPRLGSRDLRALYAGPDGRLTMVMDDSYDRARLLTCAGSTCRETDFTFAERAAADGADAPYGNAVAASAQLPDGRLALTTWRTLKTGDRTYHGLGLLVCERGECAPANPGAILTPTVRRPEFDAVAMAARPDGGLVIAQIAEEWDGEGSPAEDDAVTFTFCADVVCARPRTIRLGSVEIGPSGDRRVWSVAVGPDNRPVAAYLDHRSGALTVYSCDTPSCDRPRITRPVGPAVWEDPYRWDAPGGLALTVRPNGLPVIAYQVPTDGTVRLMDCVTLDCTRFGTAVLTGPVGHPAVPAVTLDEAGHALVAFHDLERRRLALAVCAGTRCARTTAGVIRHGAGDGMALVLDGLGRPVIARMDGGAGPFDGWDLVVTTLLGGVSPSGDLVREAGQHRGAG